MSVAVLLQLADGRFPAGGHAHSGGTEPACGVGDVIDVASLRSYVEGRLATSGRVDASFSASACALVARGASADDWRELDAELAARTLSPAARRAGRTLGRQLLRAGGRVWPHPCLAVVRAAVADGVLQPVALGAVAGAAGLAPIDAAICTLHHLLTGITSAALRLLGLDPFEIARLHGDVAGVIDTLAADAEATSRAAASPAGLPADVGLLADILAEHHTTWDVRLFAS